MNLQEPLRLIPRSAEAIWGGRRLAEVLHRPVPTDRPVGETWEVFGENVVAHGRFAGRTLDDVVRLVGLALVGDRVFAADGPDTDFPLLVKFIDAHAKLSVQVHPDDAYARRHEQGSRGKTEAWYVIDAPADGTLIYGLSDGVDAARLAASIGDGTLEQDLALLPVRAGDAVFVPAGTIHAIGAGILLYEVQQRSQITYRLYDWGRVGPDGRPRELHVAKALDVLRFPQPQARTTPRLTVREGAGQRTFLAACRYFALEALEGTIAAACDGGSFAALTVVSGTARLQWSGGAESLALGESIVLPAKLGDYQIDVAAGGRVLRATVPDLRRDVIAPLEAAGYSDTEILGLGDLAMH